MTTNPASSSRDAPDSGSSTAMQMKNEAKATIKATAKEGARAVETRAQSMAALGMAQAGEHLRGLSRALESTRSTLDQEDSPLAGAFGSVQGRVDAVARSLAEHDPAQLMDQTESLARRNPWLFLGGCFVGGIVLARFLKASEPERPTVRYPYSQHNETFSSTMPPVGADARGGHRE